MFYVFQKIVIVLSKKRKENKTMKNTTTTTKAIIRVTTTTKPITTIINTKPTTKVITKKESLHFYAEYNEHLGVGKCITYKKFTSITNGITKKFLFKNGIINYFCKSNQ